MAGAVVNVCTSIGNHCIINTGAVIEHDNSIDDYVHLSPRVALGGAVHIGRCTHVGIGASVKIMLIYVIVVLSVQVRLSFMILPKAGRMPVLL